MKLLMIYCERFAYRPRLKTRDEAPDGQAGAAQDVVVGMIHVEPTDLDPQGTGVKAKVVTRLVKHLKWLARKNDTRRVVLHSFSHLAEEKADAGAGSAIFQQARQRLVDADYEVAETPYGYFNDLDLQAPGHPLARVFKNF